MSVEIPDARREKKKEVEGSGVRTLPGRFVLLAAVVEGSPGQSRAILVAGLLSGSRNQYRFGRIPRFGSMRFGRQAGNNIVQLWSAGGCSSFVADGAAGYRRRSWILVNPWADSFTRSPMLNDLPRGREVMGAGEEDRIEGRS